MKVRMSALYALAAINKRDAAEFIRSVIIDEKLSMRLRRVAIQAVANGDLTELEPFLNDLVANAAPPIRAESMIALVEMRPDKYFGQWMDAVMDPKAEKTYRFNLAEGVRYLPKKVIKDNKEMVYECLEAKTMKGKPADKVRVEIWDMITDKFGERPPLVLSKVTEDTKRDLRQEFQLEILRNNRSMGILEREKLAGKRVEEFVKIYKDDSDSETPKEK